jgi:hypothetical protein
LIALSTYEISPTTLFQKIPQPGILGGSIVTQAILCSAIPAADADNDLVYFHREAAINLHGAPFFLPGRYSVPHP